MDDKINLLFKINTVCVLQGFLRLVKKLCRFMGDQFIVDIIFIPEVQIKGSFGNACFFYDIGDSSFSEAFRDKKVICGVIQGPLSSVSYLILISP